MKKHNRMIGASLLAAVVFGICPAWADDSQTTPRLKSSIQQSADGAVSDVQDAHDPPIKKPLELLVHMERGKSVGTKNDIMAIYEEKTGVTQKDYQDLISSPLVQSRVEEWRSFYTQFFDELSPDKSEKIPSDIRTKISLMVTKNGKISANIEWMDPTENKSTKEFIDNYLRKVRSISPATLQFPDKSYLDLLKLAIYIQGHDESYTLDNETLQALDYDR